ncbi:MAG: hypothetical protein DWG80_03860 [Chloroflexi bacterium]|nr:hypothetical protein [Chloroflexota bacterium]MQC18196.1 hypothetical protein [Chloroflexota bacterium]
MTSEPHQRFYVEFDPTPAEPCPVAFADDPVIVLFFQSWAYSLDFGGTHELAQAAQYLKTKQKVDLKPLLKYADRDVETPNDQRELDRSWQPAGDLAACARAVAIAWTAPDDTLRPLIKGYAHLAPRLLELAAMCDWAADAHAPAGAEARVRMSFLLETPEARTSRPAGY